MTTRTLLAASFAVLVAACGSTAGAPDSRVAIHAAFAVSQASVTRVTVTATAAGVSGELFYSASTDQYVGALLLPAGEQPLVVEAWADANLDGVEELVARGTATTTVVEGQTATIMVRLVDLSPPPPVPDHAPIITSFQIGNSNPAPGEQVALSVTAVDVDGDAMSYEWWVSCNAGVVTLLDSAAASTSFSVDAPGLCTVTVSVTANALADTAQAPVPIGAPGEADVNITFVERPVITQVTLVQASSGFTCAIDRLGSDATCADPVGRTTLVDVFVAVDASSSPADVWLHTSCGGALAVVSADVGPAHFTWEAPPSPGVCVVTAELMRDGVQDGFPVAVLVQ
jgi:hypothetical protein